MAPLSGQMRLCTPFTRLISRSNIIETLQVQDLGGGWAKKGTVRQENVV